MKVSTFFEMTAEEQRKFKLITELQKCRKCGGDGICLYCAGGGESEHDCDCEYCDRSGGELCFDCGGSGECVNCGGSGYALLSEHELVQAGLEKGEARAAIIERNVTVKG